MAIPVIRSPLVLDAAIGAPVRYQIRATNFPTSFSTSVMPYKLTLNAETGLISGKIQKAGSYNVFIRAINDDGTGEAELAINATDEGGGGGGDGPISVYQDKVWNDDAELLEYSDLDQASHPVVSFNPDSIGEFELTSDAVANKMAQTGGPGRILQYVFPEQKVLLPVVQRNTIQIGTMAVAGAKIGDFVLLGELLDVNGLYLGATDDDVRNAIFFGVAYGNTVSFYGWNVLNVVIPKNARFNFRLFSYPASV